MKLISLHPFSTNTCLYKGLSKAELFFRVSNRIKDSIHQERIKDSIHPESCAICLETLNPQQRSDPSCRNTVTEILGCSHMLHAACLGRMLDVESKSQKDFPQSALSSRCPLCRHPLNFQEDKPLKLFDTYLQFKKDLDLQLSQSIPILSALRSGLQAFQSNECLLLTEVNDCVIGTIQSLINNVKTSIAGLQMIIDAVGIASYSVMKQLQKRLNFLNGQTQSLDQLIQAVNNPPFTEGNFVIVRKSLAVLESWMSLKDEGHNLLKGVDSDLIYACFSHEHRFAVIK